MGLSQSLLPEFDQEMANTRKTLERVPDEKFAWKPHEKSMPMGNLAGHLANLPSWGTLTISSDSFDLAPGGRPVKTTELSSTKMCWRSLMRTSLQLAARLPAPATPTYS